MDKSARMLIQHNEYALDLRRRLRGEDDLLYLVVPSRREMEMCRSCKRYICVADGPRLWFGDNEFLQFDYGMAAEAAAMPTT